MLTETAKTVLKRRYYLKGEDGECVENWPALCSRVALAVASQEPDKAKRKAYQEAFFSMIHDLDFLPNSPCLMNAGTGIGQLSACFVLPVDDSMDGIFTAVRNGALVHKTGGGTGYSFSRLRAKNTAVKSTQGIASGPLSFMEVFNTATETIKQGGKRRGANMAVLRVDHPDILEFIDAKEDLTKFTNFNFSVALTDEFMKKVEAGNEEALAIFNRIVDRAWRTGEPGVLFIDTANRDNPTPHLGDFEATNPSLIKGTKVWTAEGIKPIEQLEGVDFEVRNLWGGNSPATCWKSGTDKKLYTLTFQGGHKHYATPEHKWPVILKDGSIVKRRSDELEVDDLVVKGGFEFSISNSTDYTRNEGFLTGWNIGDGWRTDLKDGRVQYGFIVTGDKRQPSIIDQLSIALDNVGCKTSLFDKDEVNLSAVGLRDFFHSIGYSGKENGLPSKVWDGVSEQFIIGLIDGLFSSDGSINTKNNRIVYTTKDEVLARDLSELLSFYGIKSGVRKSSSTSTFPNGKDYGCEFTRFDLTINNYVDIVHFHSVFSLSNGLKQQALDEIVSSLPDFKKLLYSDGVRVKAVEFGEVSSDVWDISVKDETHCFKISHVVTGNCGEQPLLPYESCNLGSINLGNFVMENQTIDYGRLSNTVKVAMRFLDNVVDCNNFPIPEIAEMTQNTRKTGLGIMGLHDMLIQLRLPYDSEEGRSVAGQVMQFVKETALSYSEELVQEKGVFPAYIASADYAPRRNAALTSIQPTGTVSMIADCASGCEPYFSIVMVKNVMDGDRLLMVNKHFERIARDEGWYSDELMEEIARSGTAYGNTKVPPYWQEIFATAQDISPEAHILMQAALQVHVDASISKTINLPNSATKEDVSESYMMAWRLGCKGLTVYRDGCRDNQVLNVGIDQDKPEATAIVSQQAGLHKASLPDVLSAKRYRLKDANQETMYLIVCFDENERPMEVFAKFPFDNQHNLKDKSTMWTTTCRMVSLALRCSIPMEEIIKQLDRSSGHMLDLPAQLGKLLKSFMATTQRGYAAPCPECEGGMLVFKEGCESCEVCGYSKCS